VAAVAVAVAAAAAAVVAVSHWQLEIRIYDRICTHPTHHAKRERRCLHFGGNPRSLLQDVNRDDVRGHLPLPASSSSSQLSNGAEAVLPRSVSAVCRGARSSSVTPRGPSGSSI